MTVVLDGPEWAQQQFGTAELGDRRRTRRAVKLAGAFTLNPSASVPEVCGTWKDTKAAYGLFKSMDVRLDNLLQPHWSQTRQALGQVRTGLLLSDTTVLTFNHWATQGLGPVSDGGRGWGMLLHNTLAVDVSAGPETAPAVVGLAWQQAWSRPDTAAPRKADVPPESAKWVKAIHAVGSAPAGVDWIHVGDAESDCWEAFEAAQELSVGYVFRSGQERRAAAGHAEAVESKAGLLWELIRGQAPWGGKDLWVRSRPGRSARWAKLLVSAMPVTLFAPKNWSSKEHRRGRQRPLPLRCWAVRVWEIDAPEGEEPIEWVLLTSQPVEDLESALLVAFWYSCRWLVEEYHKAMKTGCRVEDRQLEHADRLEPLVGMLSVVAVRLVQLKQWGKMDGQRPATSVVPKPYVEALAAHRKLPRSMSVREFWREVAKLGGFLARKGDGDPGWLTLWRGWRHLETLTQGYQLARRIT
jgi:hypothetical protein